MKSQKLKIPKINYLPQHSQIRNTFLKVKSLFFHRQERPSTAITAASNCREAPQAADDVKKPLVNCPCSVSVVSPPLPTRQFVLTALQILRVSSSAI
ncbi:hypothetical protein ACOSP7_019808 [Xanthoceras sorbifolium]